MDEYWTHGSRNKYIIFEGWMNTGLMDNGINIFYLKDGWILDSWIKE